MTLKTLAALQDQATTPEVQKFLAELAKNGYRVNSREWHYLGLVQSDYSPTY
jgi:hypothetical protein